MAAGLLLVGCGPKSASGPLYEMAAVQRGDVTQVVTASGTLSALVSVDVGSQISGRIQSLKVDFNSQVKKGQIIAEIEPVIYQAAVNQSAGELESAKAARQLAVLTAQRKRELVEKKAGTQADADKADAELLQAKATVIIKEAQLAKAQADLDHCLIEAPVDGIVISRKVDTGQTVAAVMTTPVLYTIAQDITKMHIIAAVSEADIGGVAVGQAVHFTVDAFPDDVFTGTVSQVRKAATTTNNVVTYDTVIDVENPEQKLFPGMTAEVSICVAERHDVLTVPNAALRFAPPAGARFAGEGGKDVPARGRRTVYLSEQAARVLKVASIKTGAMDNLNAEVVEGLKENEAVVVGTLNVEAGKGGLFGPPPGGPPPQ
ncbi:MAG: efflux RND transporter periplasmic adaptor subunit [Chthoniobacter sp.]|nr:efflux RND transporter periplasmic adaptor subunit [Chthoniobacter sp.]